MPGEWIGKLQEEAQEHNRTMQEAAEKGLNENKIYPNRQVFLLLRQTWDG